MSELTTKDGPLSVEQTSALIAELLAHSPGRALGTDDIADAMAAISELYTSAAMLQLWRDGAIKFGWDADGEQLVLHDATQVDPDGDGRLILRGN
ncbi:hypothetical protein [Mycolicibacterium iranicum]|uniref:Uncharacterized protein n=1 Tax=Mycolicibacterium iranicum TaxID=912594 RepID=A0ABT4HNR4_MYCIR|nr:hypothetical protein [Mycolicibacterium iranicum]MCZ0731863.1 hypothetical protein [Mycolicibacterium iranicum]